MDKVAIVALAVPLAALIAGIALKGHDPETEPKTPAAVASPAPPQNEAEPLHAWTGRVSVIDGDSLEMRGRNLRLHGIDAPESAQTCEREGESWRCGQQAALALADFLRDRVLSCDQLDIDFYNRPVVRCFQENQDVAAWLVSEGWAVAFRRYSTDYVDEEDAARRAKRGIWAGKFEYPEEYRRNRRK